MKIKSDKEIVAEIFIYLLQKLTCKVKALKGEW